MKRGCLIEGRKGGRGGGVNCYFLWKGPILRKISKKISPLLKIITAVFSPFLDGWSGQNKKWTLLFNKKSKKPGTPDPISSLEPMLQLL